MLADGVHVPCGGLVLGRCVGYLWCLVRLAALGWSDRFAHVDISVFAETVVTRRWTEVLPLALVLPDAVKHHRFTLSTVKNPLRPRAQSGNQQFHRHAATRSAWEALPSLGPFHGAIAVPSVTRCRCCCCR